MKQLHKRTRRWTRLTALLLTLALLLAGCAAAPAEAGGSPSETGTPSEISEISGTEPSDGSTGNTVPLQDEPDGSDEPDETPVSPEEQELLARVGLLEGEMVEISTEEAGSINQTVAGMETAYVAGPNGEDSLVQSRDWDIYSSSLGHESMPKREAEFCRRLDKMCLKYLSTSGLNGVKYTYNNGKDVYYATKSVPFSDLGLSKNQAYNVYTWFRYNHPQYYFLNIYSLSDGSSLYPCMFEIMADAEKRAEITNELFDKLEDWVQQAKESSSTTYGRELFVNNLLCVENKYEEQYEKPPEGGMRYDQSLYSSVLLGKTVCAGYAMAFTAMMNALGIDTTAGLSVGHAWNVVRFDDGNYYAVDVCWNDRDLSSLPYKNDYLNVGEEIMYATNSRKESHTYQDKYASWIPAIAKESYVPTGDEEPIQLAAPQNFRAAEAGTTSITLAWDEASGAERYEVIMFKDASRSKTWHSSYPSGTTVTFGPPYIELQPDTSYEFGIRSMNRSLAGTLYSGWAYLSVTTAADDSTTSQIAAPLNFRATASGEDEVMLEWDPVAGATVYEKCAYTDATYTQILGNNRHVSSADKGTTFYWTGLTAGSAYYLGVRAGKEVNGETVYSDWTNITYTHTPDGGDPSGGVDTLAAPANVKVAPSKTGGDGTMTWDPVDGAETYDICLYTDATYSTIIEGGIFTHPADEGTSYRWLHLKEGKTYHFGVRAGKEVNGETAYSDWTNVSYEVPAS